MLTDLFEIEADFGLFVLHFHGFHFNKFFVVEKKKTHALHAQIKTVFYELIAQNCHLFGCAFCLTTRKVGHKVLLQAVLLVFEGEGLMGIEDLQVREDVQKKNNSQAT